MEWLNDYFVTIVVGICLCVGYVIKQLNFVDNKYIPLIVGILGVAINVWYAGTLTPEVLLGGLFSGLASTGLYELFTQMINKEK